MPLVIGLKSYIHQQLEEVMPLVTGVESCVYTSPTGRNYVVSY